MAIFSRLLPNRYSWALVIFQLCFAAYLIFFITPSGLAYYVLFVLVLLSLITAFVQTRREWANKRWKSGKIRALVGGLMLLCLAIYLFVGISHAQQVTFKEYQPCMVLLSVLAAPPIICFSICLAAEYLRRPVRK
jgi:NADH:ubiquinone oxidoreductase subunit 6 (subunit J)